MRYSQSFGKTKKTAPKDEESINAQLLIRGGFVHKEMAGVYDLLPLGYIVSQKIVQVVREEMNNIGGQELYMTALQNAQPWKDTNRWDDEIMDVWFKTKLKNDTELGLAPTHEEPLAKLLTNQIQSYKDLPLYAYQFQTKFRNELRAKGGLLRGREFLMKDLYSFNRTQEELDDFYEKVKQAYVNIFKRLGIGKRTYLTFASGGTFSKYSHEFQTVYESGEDTIYLDEKKGIAINKEVYTDEVIKDLGLNREELKEVKGIEVGNIFKQGTRFSEPLGLKYTNETGEQKTVITGAYGIGIGRLMATIVELFHDEKGIIWPENIAPYKIHLIGLNLEDIEVKEVCEDIYSKLQEHNIEVIYDDRVGIGAGEKFGDADLIGCPIRAVVSVNTKGKVEIKYRGESKTEVLSPSAFLKSILI